MQRVVKPKNARSKRAMKAREPQVVEGPKTAIFVKGSQTSQNVNLALSELAQLKKPDCLLFNKKNAIHPFEDSSSLAFWSHKNDASLFLVGLHSKKRPNDLIWARTFDGNVMEMLETGVDKAIGMSEFKGIKTSPSSRPLFQFSGHLFDTHPLYIQFKSFLLDFFHGQMANNINLSGVEHVICVTAGTTDIVSSVTDSTSEEAPAPLVSLSDPTAGPSSSSIKEGDLPKVHFRVYKTVLLRSGSRIPKVQLEPHGPFLDFSLRRTQSADPAVWKTATKHVAPKAKPVDGDKKKQNKNVDIDEMGDTVGQIHVGRQFEELEKQQQRKMKGLKRGRDESESEEDEEEDE
ncbi:Brix-domain-containing protein, partial [Atractiella rhizophila]